MNRTMESLAETSHDGDNGTRGRSLKKFAVVRDEIFPIMSPQEPHLFSNIEPLEHPEDLSFQEGFDFTSDDETDPDEKILGI
jgi:hypothetical protein